MSILIRRMGDINVIRKLLFVNLVLMVSVLLSGTAYAHVLLRDDNKQIGAILHVYPDDDPIAGQQSSLLYDIQLSNSQATIEKSQLVIIDANGTADVVPIKFTDISGDATYTFSNQGVYRLRLSISSQGADYVFNYAQRVTRGTSTTALARPSYAWAEAVLVTCASLGILLLIIGINRRHEITRQSTF